MTIESTREVMLKYFNAAHDDAGTLAKDVVFTLMATGDENKGPDSVMGMLNYFYHIAFDATAEPRTMVFGEDNAVGEFDFVGKHIGEFAGIPATGKDVRIPLCVVYDLEGDKIKRGRIYLETPVLLKRLGVKTG